MSGITNQLTGPSVSPLNSQQFIPEQWLQETIAFLQARTVTTEMVRQFTGLLKKGDAFHIPRTSELRITDKVVDQPVSIQANDDNELIIQIDTDRYCAVGFDAYLDLVSSYDIRAEYLRSMAYAIDKDMTGALLGLRAAIMANPLSSIYASSTGTIAGNGQQMNLATFLRARAQLLRANVPANELMYFVDPIQEAQLMTVPQFISVDFINNKPISNGMIGTLLGVKIISTALITENSATGWLNGKDNPEPTPGFTGSRYLPKNEPFLSLPATFTGNSAPVITGLMCHKEWAAMVTPSKPKITQSFENAMQINLMVDRNVYGTKIFRPECAVLVHTSNTIV
jgi:hypothetical protein